MIDEELYTEKNKYLSTYFEEVSPKEFYRAVFPEGSFERAGHPEDAKGNGILTVISGGEDGRDAKAKNLLVFDDLDMIDEMLGQEFVILSAVSYSGRNRTAQNARWLYGITIDLDGVEMQNLRDLFFQMENDVIPQCTYCVNSGHGMHLYYLLEKPVPLYRHMQDRLRDFKYELISKIWNRYTSTFTERDQVQYQGIFQAFRMVGSQSKLGKDYPVRAFETGSKVTIEYLNDYLMDKTRAVTNFNYQSDFTLNDAKQKYPEWYERRITRGEDRGRWHVKRDLYDWWLKKIKDGATVGHRYSCISVLAAYGVKCDIPEDEVLSDALSLLPSFDAMSNDEHNRFTRKDVIDAMNLYSEDYVTFSRKEAERVSGIVIPPNKRNGRKQSDHIKLMNFVRDEINGNKDWRNKDGRPKGSGTAEHIVKEWRRDHPDGRKADCIRETGLSKPTVLKWWKGEPDKDRRESAHLVITVVDPLCNDDTLTADLVKSMELKVAKMNREIRKANRGYK